MTEPVLITVKRYQCPHCSRTHSKKAAATAHIARCWRNPDTKSCKTCRHLTPPEEGPYPEHPGWPEQCDVKRSLTNGLRTGCPLWTAIHHDD